MTAGYRRPTGRDPDTRAGIAEALHKAYRAYSTPLLIDQAADAAFVSSIERLRGANGRANGGDNQ